MQQFNEITLQLVGIHGSRSDTQRWKVKSIGLVLSGTYSASFDIAAIIRVENMGFGGVLP